MTSPSAERSRHETVLVQESAGTRKTLVWCPETHPGRMLHRLLAAAEIDRLDAQGNKVDVHALNPPDWFDSTWWFLTNP